MSVAEKCLTVIAILCTLAIIFALAAFPELRYLKPLLIICFVGFVINIGLMFVVLRDIFLRPFPNQHVRLRWLVIILLCWPAILYYLPRYGFKPRI